MATSPKRRKVLRRLVVAFRWCRICVWLVVLAVVAALAYLHLVGLPNFVKVRLLQAMRERGMNAQFSGARLGWSHEVLVENVSFGQANAPLTPSFSVGLAEAHFDLVALLHRQVKVESFRITKGNLLVPLEGTDGKSLALNQVELQLRFLPGDCVQLENASGVFHGLSLRFEGVLTNFSAISGWKFGAETNQAMSLTNQHWQSSLRQFAATVDRIHFSAPPILYGKVQGDARDPDSLRADLLLNAPDARTPWGTMKNFKLAANCSQVIHPGDAPFAHLRISAGAIETTWGGGRQFDLQMALARSVSDPSMLEGTVEFGATNLNAAWHLSSANWIRGGSLKWDGKVLFAQTNFDVLTAKGNLEANNLDSSWGSAARLSVSLASFKTNTTFQADESWGAWSNFEPYCIDWQARASAVQSPLFEFEVGSLNFSGRWRAPEVTLDSIDAELYEGSLHASASLDVASRVLRAHSVSDCHTEHIVPLLGPETTALLTQFGTVAGPKVKAEVGLIVPPWTGWPADWPDQVYDHMYISGTVKAGQGWYRNIPVSSADVTFIYTNQTWILPRLHAIRPDGDFWMDLFSDDKTHEYKFVFDTQLDPRVAANFLSFLPQRDYWLGQFQYAPGKPPKAHTELWGNWLRNDVGAKSQIEVSDFKFFNQSVKSLKVSIDYTNDLLQIAGLEFHQETNHLTAPLIQMQCSEGRVNVTNLLSTLDASWIPRLLGTNQPGFFSEIAFQVPPSVKVNGSFSTHQASQADLHFQIAAQRFRWTNALADTITGNLDWVGPLVRLTDVQATGYGGGKVAGWVVFDGRTKTGTDVSFSASVNEVDLPLLLRGLTGKSLVVEGKLDGEVTANGNSESRQTWQGAGDARLRDALIWDIPVFGIFSPILNSISSGSGNSRAREATGTFVITNGVLHTSDLLIHAVGFDLLYRGTLDGKQINAKAEAKLLRDAPVVGWTLSIILKPVTKAFEYKITGSVDHPVIESTYLLPDLLSIPMHPIHSLKSLFPERETPAPIIQSTPQAK